MCRTPRHPRRDRPRSLRRWRRRSSRAPLPTSRPPPPQRPRRLRRRVWSAPWPSATRAHAAAEKAFIQARPPCPASWCPCSIRSSAPARCARQVARATRGPSRRQCSGRGGLRRERHHARGPRGEERRARDQLDRERAHEPPLPAQGDEQRDCHEGVERVVGQKKAPSANTGKRPSCTASASAAMTSAIFLRRDETILPCPSLSREGQRVQPLRAGSYRSCILEACAGGARRLARLPRGSRWSRWFAVAWLAAGGVLVTACARRLVVAPRPAGPLW